MTLLDQNEALLRKQLARMRKGAEAGLVEIFGEEWHKIGTAGERRHFGRLFKKAVQNNIYPEIEWIRIENSGRFDVYRKK